MKVGWIGLILVGMVFIGVGVMYVLTRQEPKSSPLAVVAELVSPTPVINKIIIPGESGSLRLPKFEKQTFNNCGPSTLSMVLAYFGIEESAAVLGQKIRPYQHPKGDNDDKTVFAEEYAHWADEYGLKAVARPNGNVEMLKKLVANGLPVTVKTLLHDNDDIAHFRIIRGWDDHRQQLLQDDSYEGRNKWYDYKDFEELWRPFGKGYIVVYRPDQEELVKSILGEDWDEDVAWINAEKSAQGISKVVALYHMMRYEEATGLFEEIENSLPRRTMWYQIEPILAYQKLDNFDRVLQLTDKLLNDGNRAYSELYQIRGEMYRERGDTEAARKELELAVYYNKNYQPAKQALGEL